MLCACILYVCSSLVGPDPWDEMRRGPWGRRPEDPQEWSIDWRNWDEEDK